MLRRINTDELDELAAAWNLNLGGDERGELALVADALLEILDGVQERVDARPALPAIRDAGVRPKPDEDPLNAILRSCSVRAREPSGPLAGMRVALKDSMAIAGIPLTAGSRLLDTYVPRQDSVVAERLLRAGAEIVAITNMDDLAFSGGGDSSAFGPTLNPFDRSRTAGGSSGGSAAVLHYDGIDAALGTDQGGSIRVPAAWCGRLGLKPTHSLVPYTGVLGIDATFDHAGPITRNVADLARLMDVLAGADPSDPRQQHTVPVPDFARAVAEAPASFESLRVGLVEDGFSDAVGIDPGVADAVRRSAEQFAAMGATLTSVSLPEHVGFGDVAFAGFIEGMTALMTGGGNGYHWAGRYDSDLALALGEGLSARADRLAPQVKVTLMLGLHLRRAYHGSLYARAQNARPALRAGYDHALADVDVLLMPTTAGLPHHHLPDMPMHERVLRGWALLANTSPTNMTGHPALTIPAEEVCGLPVGVMLVGRHFDDARLVSLAAVYEASVGWRPAPA